MPPPPLSFFLELFQVCVGYLRTIQVRSAAGCEEKGSLQELDLIGAGRLETAPGTPYTARHVTKANPTIMQQARQLSADRFAVFTRGVLYTYARTG